jgi:alkylation response protein AidB-like acyl-CoA dehydrogenase
VTRLTETDGLTDVQRDILAAVREFVVEDALRIHGGFGYSRDSEIERLYRDAPLLLIGEGTAEIQKMIIGNRLIEKYRIS